MKRTLLIVSLVLAASSAQAGPVEYTETVEGTAKVLTAATVAVNGVAVRLAGVLDLDEPQHRCSWRFKTIGRKEIKLSPSIDAASYVAKHCENPHYTWRRGVGGHHMYGACQISMTAVDQASQLAGLVAGKTVSCAVPSDSDMKPIWKASQFVSRHGYRVRPGNCTVGGKSLNSALLETGWAQHERVDKRLFIDPEDHQRRVYFDDVVQEAKRTKTGSRAALSICAKDGYADYWPERSNPRPDFGG